MNLAVITPCVYPDMRPIHYLTESCSRHNIELRPHGVGQPFADWRSMLVRYTLPHMRELSGDGFSHVLYVDGVDTMFVAGLDEIIAKFLRIFRRNGGSRCLMSADRDIPIGIRPDKWEGYGIDPWRYLNAGAYIAEIKFMVKLWEDLERVFEQEGNYQRWLELSWPIDFLSLDYHCEIFQSMDGHPSVIPNGNRVLNAVTGNWPCVLHFRGGYCDPRTGRDERMKPWVEALTK